MLNAQELRKILENKYNRNDWYKILRQNFNVSVLRDNPPPIIAVKGNKLGATAYELGEFDTSNDFKVGIYEVDVPGVKQIHRNKVELRNLLQNVYTTSVDAALIVFTQGDKWRFSYVSEVTTRNPETGEREKIKTDSKRYTYLFGNGEKAKTAADRFAGIQQADTATGEGTTLKALQDAFSVEEMSKDFFKKYRHHYGAFLTFLIGENEDGKSIGTASGQFKTIFNADHKKARDFVKKMLGRIVFLYFLEKKGWMGVPEHKTWGDGDPDFLRNLFNDSNNQDAFYSLVLEPLFHNTLNQVRDGDFFDIDDSLFKQSGYSKLKIPFLNGGLFEAEAYKTDFLTFPANLFKSLFDFFDQYNFTVHEDSPQEHTVAVDPEMLGHIFENLLEDNKDKGAFYTPKEIVHYMCQESLIEYLYTQCKVEDNEQLRDALERFIKNQELGDIAEYEEAILKALRDVKICDPAIGSGAFPMGILLEIFHAVETLNFAVDGIIEKVWDLKEWNPAKIKLSIIENSIYGVDIEPGAVDIARLRFWLSLVVDEVEPQPLPNLDYKIVVGNSLISKFEGEVVQIDWEVTAGTEATKNRQHQIQENLKKLLSKQRQFFSYKGDKKKLQSEIRSLKIDVLISQLELDKYKYANTAATTGNLFEETKKEKQKSAEIAIQISGYDKAIKKLESLKKVPDRPLNFFDWKLDFPEVLNSALKPNGDLISTTGFDIVIGNPPYLDNRAIDSDIKLNAGFKQVNKKSFRPNLYLFFIEQALRILKNNQVLIFINPNQFLSTEMGFGIRSYILDEFSIIRIDDVSYLKVFKEASTYTSIFIIKKAFKDGQRIIINRCSTLGDLGKISFSLNNRNIIATPSKLISLNINNELVTKIEAKHKQFEHFGKFLWGTSQSGYGALKISQQEYNDLPNGKRKLYEPIIQTADIKKFHINWKGEYIPVEIFSDSVKANFNKPKLVIARLTKTLQCSIDFNKFYVGKSTVITDIAIDLDYLLGLLNSKVIDFWYYAKFETTHMQGGYIRYDLPYLKQIPIPIPDKETMNSIAEIAINLRKNIDFIENLHNLNLKIFKLYNLDYNSAFSIDPEIKMSEIEYNNFLLN
ncbi:Eco57I restriction-modification methylase domain-containing protein [Mucilaginibacter rubeus]|uniref:Eco57I restriction-modification methylase domain-containing protein n=1 Tax=Mucilaginibacter rubeus TaxID=2027860 RepID=UPI001665CE6A|nr:TaqI-like C-terminal specificity domain-containing protein [Mucilaginibacter rubeus]GGB20689.1 hypothetical protein GCM10011500_40970 [Mucilaginibacter rubeus]